jgi:predicted HTH transcriptional regulator
MLKTLLIILLILLIATAAVYFLKIKNDNKKHSSINKNLKGKNKMNKERIMRLFENKERITNQDVQSVMLIEESETDRYLVELGKEGKIKQIGIEGENVYYLKVEEEKKRKYNS